MINRGFSKFIWFYLIHKDKGINEIPNPIGWREGNKSSKREDDHSISIIIGNSLEYYGLGLEILKDIRYNIGISENVELLCQIRNPLNPKKRKTIYRGNLDLTTFETKDNKCTVKFKKSTLEETLKSSKSQKIELEREETLIGTTATTLQTKDILVKGKNLFLQSKLVNAIDPETKNPYYFDVNNERDGKSITDTRIAFPLDISFSSHPDDVTNISSDTGSGETITGARGADSFSTNLVNASFFTQSEQERKLNINLNLKFNLKHGVSDEFISDTFKVILRVHSQISESLTDFKEPEYVLFERIYSSTGYNQDIVIDKDFNLENGNQILLNRGDSLSLHILFKSQLGNQFTGGIEHSRCKFTFQESIIKIKEDNTTPEQVRKTIKAFDLGKKIIELITGNANHFHSPILETGVWNNLTLSSGLWVRGFYGLDYNVDEEDAENPNDRQRIKASLDDFINFCDTKLALGVSFKTIDGVEKICIEPIKDKYRNKVLINLEKQPYDFSRKVLSDLLFTGCKFGDEFADVEADADLYEEIYGLSEFNTLSEWSTDLNIKENIYEKVSKYRSDGTGKTLALKKSIENYPNTDTRFDDSMFMFHVKDIDADILEERTWIDDFTQAPANIYSPDDATNLLFTPKQMFKRHNFLFNTELKKSIKYLSGRGNNSLITRNGSVITIENEDVPLSERQKFLAEEISFSYPYSNNIVDQINGQTIINGEEVLNVHGLIQFRNEEGKMELGYLNEVKEDKKLEFKIIAIKPITSKL
tara:strand:+ start:18195 stop:20480 length:2286 start_codon:yes stop_codon:yes gene_type:complete